VQYNLFDVMCSACISSRFVQPNLYELENYVDLVPTYCASVFLWPSTIWTANQHTAYTWFRAKH